MHEASFEMIEIPHVRQSGKNSADIRMVVDALDLCYTKSHVDTFVIISGDSDFSALVSKLRENNKVVIGVGVKNSTSDLLIANCDEFIYYDDLARRVQTPGRGQAPRGPRHGRRARRRPRRRREKAPAEEKAPLEKEEEKKEAQEALDLVVETVAHLFDERGEKDKIWGSHGQAGSEAAQARFQRALPRLPLFRQAAGGSPVPEAAGPGGGREIRRLPGQGGYPGRLTDAPPGRPPAENHSCASPTLGKLELVKFEC